MLAIAMGICLRGIVSIPGLAYLVLQVVWSFFGTQTFLIDKLVASLLPGLWLTLIYPLAGTAVEFLESRLNPYGSWGTTGYTQYRVLPLLQPASVPGQEIYLDRCA